MENFYGSLFWARPLRMKAGTVEPVAQSLARELQQGDDVINLRNISSLANIFFFCQFRQDSWCGFKN